MMKVSSNLSDKFSKVFYFLLFVPQVFFFLFSTAYQNMYLLIIGLMLDFGVCLLWLLLSDDYSKVIEDFFVYVGWLLMLNFVSLVIGLMI